MQVENILKNKVLLISSAIAAVAFGIAYYYFIYKINYNEALQIIEIERPTWNINTVKTWDMEFVIALAYGIRDKKETITYKGKIHSTKTARVV